MICCSLFVRCTTLYSPSQYDTKNTICFVMKCQCILYYFFPFRPDFHNILTIFTNLSCVKMSSYSFDTSAFYFFAFLKTCRFFHRFPSHFYVGTILPVPRHMDFLLIFCRSRPFRARYGPAARSPAFPAGKHSCGSPPGGPPPAAGSGAARRPGRSAR